MTKYWSIRWNAKKDEKGKILSTRIFKTFLERPEPFHRFETYGYGGKYIKRFKKVKKGHMVFCYQVDDNGGRYVGLCKVEGKSSGAPGGRCVVLARVNDQPMQLVESDPKVTIKEMDEERAKTLCENCGLLWPPVFPG